MREALFLPDPFPTKLNTCCYRWQISPLAYPDLQCGNLDLQTRTPRCEESHSMKKVKCVITSVITLVMMVHVMPTYSWSRTPEAAWPSNCCCCRMLSKSSMRWSEFSMWAGRWQLRKQMVWPNTDMRALTPPLFPCNINHSSKVKEIKGTEFNHIIGMFLMVGFKSVSPWRSITGSSLITHTLILNARGLVHSQGQVQPGKFFLLWLLPTAVLPPPPSKKFLQMWSQIPSFLP